MVEKTLYEKRISSCTSRDKLFLYLGEDIKFAIEKTVKQICLENKVKPNNIKEIFKNSFGSELVYNGK